MRRTEWEWTPCLIFGPEEAKGSLRSALKNNFSKLHCSLVQTVTALVYIQNKNARRRGNLLLSNQEICLNLL